jgi:hypothetical protein
MKTNTNLRAVDNNASSSTTFTIQASGKMFHMVISGLYSNKPQSITREIWSNAFDAHAMVGKQYVPFEVTFPTSITPTFTCRDFGPGIAHDDMEGFYTVLGHSTKENTNTAVGKWGVGRMSPMSYTDTFSVVSRHKGMIAYYTIQLGPDGSPQLHVLAPPMPTNEADGLEVSFPVKREDIHKFQTAAEIVSYGFSVPPTVSNSKTKQFEGVKKLFQGDGYYLYEGSGLNGGTYAQMGCVLYPIPPQYLDRRINAVIQFDIGDLEVTASREALSFGPNDPTEANIKKRVAEVIKNLFQKMQEQIDAQPTMCKAAQLAPKLRGFLTYKDDAFTYKGKDLPKYWELGQYGISSYAGTKGYRGNQVGWGLDRSVDLKSEYQIFIQDSSDKKANARAATRIGTAVKPYGNFIWIRADLSDMKEKAEVDRLTSDLDYTVTYVRDLPDAGPAQKSRGVVTVSMLVNNRPQRCDMSDATFAAGGYYVPMSNNEYPSYLCGLDGFVKQALNYDTILLVPKTLWKKFQGNAKWKLLEPEITRCLTLHEKSARDILSGRYDHYSYSRLAKFKHLTGVVGDFARKIANPQTQEYMGLSADRWSSHLSRLGLSEIDIHSKAKAEYQTILNKYPLLYFFADSSTLTTAFADYINLIDNASKE